MRVLLTTTSFQDTPGGHHELLESAGYEIIRARGPLPEEEMLKLVENGDIDGFLCGDDAITRAVIEKALPRLKVIAKYGIGLDAIDVKTATELKVPVTFCPGVNDIAVAEHVFGLMVCLARAIPLENSYVKSGKWKRLTGRELMGKTLGILGMGRIGRQVAKRAAAFEMPVVAFDIYWDDEFAAKWNVRRAASAMDVIVEADVLTLHMNLTADNRGIVNADSLARMKPGAYVINCARGQLVNTADIAAALRENRIAGYAADVLDVEPPPPDNPLFALDNVVLTPHIGSRTYESVERQATMAVRNLIAVLSGEAPLAQANKF